MNKLKLLMLILIFGSVSFTAHAAKNISVVIGGESLKMDSAPVVENGRTLVPMRDIFESLDAYVVWDGKTKTITALKGDTTIKIKIGSKYAEVGGKKVKLEVPAKIKGSRTLVPLRFVGEALGATVEWNSDTRTISVRAMDEEYGNSTGNISNKGFSIAKGDWIYVSTQNEGLFRIKKDGTEKEKISGNFVLNMNIVGDWIYYSNAYNYPDEDERGRLCKMKLKGNLNTKLTKYGVDCVSVVGDWIYYINLEDLNRPYKIRIDGKGEKKLSDYSIESMVVDKGWIYFKEEDDDSLWKSRTNGSSRKQLAESAAKSTCIIVKDDWVYYSDNTDSKGIFKVRTNGKDNQQVVIDDVDKFNMSEGFIYYDNISNKLFKVKEDGSQKTKMTTGVVGEICVWDEWLYYKKYSSEGNNISDIRLKTDASQKQSLALNKPITDIPMTSADGVASPRPIVLNQGPQKTQLLSTKEIARQKDAVVHIKTYNDQGKAIATGSGFNLDPSGIVVTNLHVIADASSIKCTLSDNTTYEVSYLLNYSSIRDIAILQLKDASNLPVVGLGSSSKVELGEDVVAIGNPLDMQNTISTGIISGIRKLFGIEYLQTEAPISPGSSGGPLFNMYGDVIGMTTMMLEDSQNMNFAVPIDAVKKLFDTASLIPVGSNSDIEETIYEIEKNDSKDSATEVQMEKIINGSLKDKDDKDFYKFTINKSGKIYISGMSSSEVYDVTKYTIVLNDSNGNEVGKASVVNENGVDYLSLKASVDQGTYYLLVRPVNKIGVYVDDISSLNYELVVLEELN